MDNACTEYRADLSAYMDKQLDEGRLTELGEHLVLCQSCRDSLEGMKRLSGLFGEATASISPPDLWPELSLKMPGVCESMSEDLSAYLDGELPPPAQEGVTGHLKQCPTCVQRFRALSLTNQLIVKALEMPPSIKVDLWPAVKSRLNEDCLLIQNELSPFVDQEVGTLRHRSIISHIADCTPCRNSFSELSKVGDAIRECYQPQIPDDLDLWSGIKPKLNVVPLAVKSTKQKPKAFPARKIYLTGAVAALVAAIGVIAITMRTTAPFSDLSPVSAETYLIESAMAEPAALAENVSYEVQ